MFGSAGNMGCAFLVVSLSVGALIVASVPVIRMIGWWVDGGVEPALALVGIFLYVCLVATAAAAPPIMGVVIFLVIVASAILTPVLGKVSEQAQHHRMQSERMDQYVRALEANPRDAAARIALAETLHKRGELDAAIEQLSWTLQAFPALAMRVRPQLDSWRREKERIGQVQPVICHECFAENAWNATTCDQCGAAFGTRSGIRRQVAVSGGPKAVLRGWIVTATSLILVCALLLYAPVMVAGPVAVATLMVAVWLFLRWVGGDMGTVGD